MQDSNAIPVIGNDGPIGVISSAPGEAGDVRVRLTDGREVSMPSSALLQQHDGSYFLASEETIIPVIAEELTVTKRQAPTGGIRVHKVVQEHEEVVAMSLRKEHVDIRRVIIGRDVDGPLPIRREGDTTIIPVVEEVIVVEKRMRLKEEFHITRRTTQEQTEQTVTLQREEATVERLDAEGRATPLEVSSQPPADDARAKSRPVRRNRIIPEE